MLKLKEIKKGQVFWECQSSWNMRMVALEDARTDKKGTYCEVSTATGFLTLFQASDVTTHALRLYPNAEYLPFSMTMHEKDYQTIVDELPAGDVEALDGVSYQMMTGRTKKI